ncbi:MAG: DUF1028 domain-containing protein [Methanomassiliicoccales archaeon]|jgi:uncharacterized Ntn-hydrolase superfamily protein|nr:DUF1028 domain-containing protein [Methanomassiliicoccales archaeon]
MVRDRLTHTYSIVARDPETGEMGVAVQSHWFSVGSVVTWALAGVGAVATQALTNPAYGPDGLGLMREGASANDALKALLSRDGGRAVRQVAMVDAKGGVAAHTGSRCIPEAGHIAATDFSVQANMMITDEVWPSMAKRFSQWRGSLAERMMAALEAGEEAGGDIRGRQSAALLVVRGASTGRPWEDNLVDLRVDDHREPLEELKRLLKVHRAYQHMNMGDEAMEKEDMPLALRHYSLAERMFPRNLEMRFWHAVTLANNGRLEDALPIFRKVFEKDEDWRELASRLVGVGMLKVDIEQLERILRT